MPKLKLPAPPIPKNLQPSPRKPGQPEQKPLEIAKEAGISAVDWVDEGTSLSGGVRWMMSRKAPRATNWFYTRGRATMSPFLPRAVPGVFLAMSSRPAAAGGAYESARHITNDVFLG